MSNAAVTNASSTKSHLPGVIANDATPLTRQGNEDLSGNERTSNLPYLASLPARK